MYSSYLVCSWVGSQFFGFTCIAASLFLHASDFANVAELIITNTAHVGGAPPPTTPFALYFGRPIDLASTWVGDFAVHQAAVSCT